MSKPKIIKLTNTDPDNEHYPYVGTIWRWENDFYIFAIVCDAGSAVLFNLINLRNGNRLTAAGSEVDMLNAIKRHQIKPVNSCYLQLVIG